MEEKQFKNREALLQSALREFSELGYEASSLNNILRKAKVSKGTFYYHFKDKEDLYFSLFDLLVNKKMKYYEEHMDMELLDKDLFEVLTKYSQMGIIFSKENPEIATFSERFIKDIDSDINTKLIQRYSLKTTDFFDILIQKAYERGELRTDLPKSFVIKLIKFLMQNIHQFSETDNLDDCLNDLFHLIEFLKNGLENPNHN